MFKETKIEIVNDILELVDWCYKNDTEEGNEKVRCTLILNANGQQKYESKDLFKRTLMSKTKSTLDFIRENILERVVY